MLKPVKKVTKRQIKEDRLVTTYFKATGWYDRNKKLVNGVLTAVVVLVIGIIVVMNNIRANNEKATAELGAVMRYYDDGKYHEAINGVPQENIRGLFAIVQDYGSTRAGGKAKLFLANAYFALGDYDNALKYYLDASLPDNMLQASAIAGAAACYEMKGDHLSAARHFERAASRGKELIQVADYFHLAAVNYAAAGQNQKAVELLQRVKKDHPNSPIAREADRFIAAFSSQG